jgi:hypothetical protein
VADTFDQIRQNSEGNVAMLRLVVTATKGPLSPARRDN